MLMLGRCLPHIVPNVLLAKREVNLLVLVILPSSSPPCFPIHCRHHRLLVLITNRYTQSSKDENGLKKKKSSWSFTTTKVSSKLCIYNVEGKRL